MYPEMRHCREAFSHQIFLDYKKTGRFHPGSGFIDLPETD
ncbi:hypothetical protein HMPREF3038_01977 [Akkermansia sp. KLE1797]|nr:hypothetical protein HMPREF3038_01977 [Akkermansia sp. KLE1797]KXU54699.1 hypothetical protein HMPREF3039_01172 [Akkermansia sp. KLE1798]KZA06044.1 hypothetical protein HMPREF1326_00308 [Akkermansia sp. KLE1605]